MSLKIADVLLFLIKKGPGRTEDELAEAIFGQASYQQRVNGHCRMLVTQRLVERRGCGGAKDPFRYFSIH